MDHIAEIHVITHPPFEGNFHGFGYRHTCFAGSQRKSDCSRVGAKSDTLGHPRMGVTSHYDPPIIDRKVI